MMNQPEYMALAQQAEEYYEKSVEPHICIECEHWHMIFDEKEPAVGICDRAVSLGKSVKAALDDIYWGTRTEDDTCVNWELSRDCE